MFKTILATLVVASALAAAALPAHLPVPVLGTAAKTKVHAPVKVKKAVKAQACTGCDQSSCSLSSTDCNSCPLTSCGN